MERLELTGENFNPQIVKEQLHRQPEGAIEVPLGYISPRLRQYSIFPSNTITEISSTPDSMGASYTLCIQKPMKSGDLKEVMAGSNTGVFDQSTDTDEVLNSELSLINDLLEVPDDTQFLFTIAGGLKSHDQAWNDLANGRVYAKRLSEQFEGNVVDIVLADSARNILTIMREHPELWIFAGGRIQGLSNASLLGKFAKLPPPFRKKLMDEDLVRFEDTKEAQRKRIQVTSGIRFGGDLDGKTWYLTGGVGEVERVGNKIIEIKSDPFGAQVVLGKDGFTIYPQSDRYLVPVISWRREGNARRFIAPGNVQKRELIVNSKSNRSTKIVYQLKDWQLRNSMAGIFALNYLTGQTDMEAWLGSELIANAERLL